MRTMPGEITLTERLSRKIKSCEHGLVSEPRMRFQKLLDRFARAVDGSMVMAYHLYSDHHGPVSTDPGQGVSGRSFFCAVHGSTLNQPRMARMGADKRHIFVFIRAHPRHPRSVLPAFIGPRSF